MSEELEIGETAKTSSSISRRNALKAATAVGVGAAAWGGPQIGILGQTPAYAQMCSQPWIEVANGDCRNTSCPDACESGGVKNVSYSAESLTGTNGATASTPGGCGDVAEATLMAPSSTGQCRLRVDVYEKLNPNGCAGDDITAVNYLTSVFSDAVAGGDSDDVTLPPVICASLGVSSIFYRMKIECNADGTPLGCA